jgi:hypothetical protein
MDKILDKIEAVIEKQIAELEANPIKTSIRLFIFYYIFKSIWREIKK